jgi:hypothetical protein
MLLHDHEAISGKSVSFITHILAFIQAFYSDMIYKILYFFKAQATENLQRGVNPNVHHPRQQKHGTLVCLRLLSTRCSNI